MKKLLFAFMLLSAFSLAGCDDKNLGTDDDNHIRIEIPDDMEEAFPDPIFRAYILENFDTDKDGKISKEEAEKVTLIKVSKDYNNTPEDEKIASLEGIQYFTNLTYLNCSSNKLTELDVTHNPALTYLDCGINQLTELDVTQNPELAYLLCSSNQLTELDVTHNSVLKALYCYFTQLTKLNVTKNAELILLSCWSNQLTELDVTKNPALETLWCNDNQLTELDVTQNPALESLWCYSNQLTTLDVSKTNFGNSSSSLWETTLMCSPMNGSGLETLYLKEGWTIKNIYPERSDDYVPANTQILFKD